MYDISYFIKHQTNLISANNSSDEFRIICCFFLSKDITVGDSSEFKNFSAGNFTVAEKNYNKLKKLCITLVK